MATFGNFWQLLATYGNFWQLMAAYGNFWKLLATFGWPSLAEVIEDTEEFIQLQGLK